MKRMTTSTLKYKGDSSGININSDLDITKEDKETLYEENSNAVESVDRDSMSKNHTHDSMKDHEAGNGTEIEEETPKEERRTVMSGPSGSSEEPIADANFCNQHEECLENPRCLLETDNEKDTEDNQEGNIETEIILRPSNDKEKESIVCKADVEFENANIVKVEGSEDLDEGKTIHLESSQSLDVDNDVGQNNKYQFQSKKISPSPKEEKLSDKVNGEVRGRTEVELKEDNKDSNDKNHSCESLKEQQADNGTQFEEEWTIMSGTSEVPIVDANFCNQHEKCLESPSCLLKTDNEKDTENNQENRLRNVGTEKILKPLNDKEKESIVCKADVEFEDLDEGKTIHLESSQSLDAGSVVLKKSKYQFQSKKILTSSKEDKLTDRATGEVWVRSGAELKEALNTKNTDESMKEHEADNDTGSKPMDENVSKLAQNSKTNVDFCERADIIVYDCVTGRKRLDGEKTPIVESSSEEVKKDKDICIETDIVFKVTKASTEEKTCGGKSKAKFTGFYKAVFLNVLLISCMNFDRFSIVDHLFPAEHKGFYNTCVLKDNIFVYAIGFRGPTFLPPDSQNLPGRTDQDVNGISNPSGPGPIISLREARNSQIYNNLSVSVRDARESEPTARMLVDRNSTVYGAANYFDNGTEDNIRSLRDNLPTDTLNQGMNQSRTPALEITSAIYHDNEAQDFPIFNESEFPYVPDTGTCPKVVYDEVRARELGDFRTVLQDGRPSATGDIAAGENADSTGVFEGPPNTETRHENILFNLSEFSSLLSEVPVEVPVGMGNLNARLRTFSHPWPHTFLTPEMMAAAGLFYTGVRDIVRCFFCRECMHDWKEGDDPMMEHERLHPGCNWVRHANRRGSVDIVHSETSQTLDSGGQCAMNVAIGEGDTRDTSTDLPSHTTYSLRPGERFRPMSEVHDSNPNDETDRKSKPTQFSQGVRSTRSAGNATRARSERIHSTSENGELEIPNLPHQGAISRREIIDEYLESDEGKKVLSEGYPRTEVARAADEILRENRSLTYRNLLLLLLRMHISRRRERQKRKC